MELYHWRCSYGLRGGMNAYPSDEDGLEKQLLLTSARQVSMMLNLSKD